MTSRSSDVIDLQVLVPGTGTSPSLLHRDADGALSLIDTNGELWPVKQLPDDALARALLRLREARAVLNDTLQELSAEVMSRMDARATWTMHAGGRTLRSTSPEPQTTWDAPKLRRALMRLARRGLIDGAAIEQAIELVPATYKPRKAGIVKLLKLGGEVAATVREHELPVASEKRRVSISTAPPL